MAEVSLTLDESGPIAGAVDRPYFVIRHSDRIFVTLVVRQFVMASDEVSNAPFDQQNEQIQTLLNILAVESPCQAVIVPEPEGGPISPVRTFDPA